MREELSKMITCILNLNNIAKKELVTSKEVDEAKENLNDFQEDLDHFKKALHKITQSNLSPNDTIELTIATLNLHLGDIIQDLQNIEELIGIAAKRYVNFIEKK